MDPTCPCTVRVPCRSPGLGTKFNVFVLVLLVLSCRAQQSNGTWDESDFSQRVPPVCEPHLFVAKEGSPQLHSRDWLEPGGQRSQGRPEVQTGTCSQGLGRHRSLGRMGQSPEAAVPGGGGGAEDS